MKRPGYIVEVHWFAPEDEDEKEEFTVTCRVSAYDPGRLSGPPEHCYPPEGGEFEEIVEVRDSNGVIRPDIRKRLEEDHWDEILERVERADSPNQDDGPDPVDE